MAKGDFLKKIKVNFIKPIFKNNNSVEDENEKIAKDLVAKLDVVFYSLPMVDPRKQRVKLPENYIEIIDEFLNTENELIIKSEYYNDIKNILNKILEYNKDGILINEEFIAMSRKVKIFYYSFQGREYWEEKSF